MGKIKDQILREEEAAERASLARAAVSGDGGDVMDNAAQDILDGNEFGRLEAEQERQAYEAKMRRDAQLLFPPHPDDDAPPSGEPDSSRDESGHLGLYREMSSGSPPESNDGQISVEEKAPESGPKPVAALPQIVGGVVKQKQRHGTLVLEGVCTHCAHCGQPLSDAESVERGIGPVCSKKGYFEEPKDSDEMQALIDIAEYPELADFLAKNYKPQGVRGLVNGLVRVCSLNRKTEVHQACTDAVESLGYKKLASLLRESLCVVEIKEKAVVGDKNDYVVWVKKAEWKPAWSWALRGIPGAWLSKADRGWVVKAEHKRQLWNLILRYYEGYFLKTKDGAVRIRREKAK